MPEPMKRDKQTAMADPRPGDRWRKRESVLIVSVAGSGASFSFEFNGYVRDAPNRIAWHEDWRPLFRRWCQSAEFLGGEE